MGGNLTKLNTDDINIESIQGKFTHPLILYNLFILPSDVFQAVSKDKFVYNYCIGKGGFGKVWRVIRKKGK